MFLIFEFELLSSLTKMIRNIHFVLTSFLILCFVQSANANIETKMVNYTDGSMKLTGYLAYNPAFSSLRPAVLVVHDWNGRDEFENGKAEALANLNYVGFAVDLYGRVGKNPNESTALMKPFRDDNNLLLRRLQLALNEVTKLAYVDQRKIAAIGFCFGGGAVLEMARNHQNVIGVVSFHGGLKAADPNDNSTVTAKVLVEHGYEDKGQTANLQAFEDEMTRRNADWQLHVYGNHTYHAFTVPTSNSPPQAQYHPVSDKRSWIAMKNFFTEIFS